jgi:hypothetical protein
VEAEEVHTNDFKLSPFSIFLYPKGESIAPRMVLFQRPWHVIMLDTSEGQEEVRFQRIIHIVL